MRIKQHRLTRPKAAEVFDEAAICMQTLARLCLLLGNYLCYSELPCMVKCLHVRVHT